MVASHLCTLQAPHSHNSPPLHTHTHTDTQPIANGLKVIIWNISMLSAKGKQTSDTAGIIKTFLQNHSFATVHSSLVAFLVANVHKLGEPTLYKVSSTLSILSQIIIFVQTSIEIQKREDMTPQRALVHSEDIP